MPVNWHSAWITEAVTSLPGRSLVIKYKGSGLPMFDDPLLSFIHEPARLILLTTLAAVKKADFVFLLNSTELTRGNLSVQMARLQEKGLVTIEKMFQENRPRTVYQITPAGRRALKRYKKEMWNLLNFLSE